MGVIQIVKRGVEKIQEEGIFKTSIDTTTCIYDYLYDWRYGLDTCSWVTQTEMNGEMDVKSHSAMYMGTKVLPLQKLFKLLEIPKGQVLVDIGSGKGRVLLVAAHYGFKDVRGIEFSPSLCSIAEKNIEKYKLQNKNKSNFSIINIDASDYQFLDDEDVFFLYNPFDPFILDKVLKNIVASLERKRRTIKIIYLHVKKDILEPHMEVLKVSNLTVLACKFVVHEIIYK